MIDKLFDSHLLQIEMDIKSSKFPKTAKALYGFYKKISSIKSLLNRAVYDKEVYASKILLRALFEHLIVSYYMYFRFQIEKNDKVGEEYYQKYYAHEFFKQQGYIQNIDNIKTNTSKNVNGLNYIKTKHPELDKITEKQYQDINKAGNSYEVVKILKYLNSVELKSKSLVALHVYMLGFLDEYNKLSSYVHGGPFSEKLIFEDKIDLQKEMSNINDWAESSLNAIKEHILLFLVDDNPDYLILLKPIMEKRMIKK